MGPFSGVSGPFSAIFQPFRAKFYPKIDNSEWHLNRNYVILQHRLKVTKEFKIFNKNHNSPGDI